MYNRRIYDIAAARCCLCYIHVSPDKRGEQITTRVHFVFIARNCGRAILRGATRPVSVLDSRATK